MTDDYVNNEKARMFKAIGEFFAVLTQLAQAAKPAIEAAIAQRPDADHDGRTTRVRR